MTRTILRPATGKAHGEKRLRDTWKHLICPKKVSVHVLECRMDRCPTALLPKRVRCVRRPKKKKKKTARIRAQRSRDQSQIRGEFHSIQHSEALTPVDTEKQE